MRQWAAKERGNPPSRPSRQQFGNPLKLDASICNQFDPSLPKAALHGAVDDATGTVMSLWFERKETPRGDYEMVWQILDKYGITESLHDDRKPIFYFQKVSEKEKTVDRDAHISLMRMCKQHGIELITTLHSQAKGRIREVRAIA